MRAHYRTQTVMRIVDPARPLPERLRDRIFQSCSTCLYRDYGGSEETHPVNVQSLALRVLLAHIYHAFHAHERCSRSRGHAVLSGACLRDQSGLAHLLRKERLSEHVVDLMRAGMIQMPHPADEFA